MQDEYGESPEESESRFEEDLERWENEPSYILSRLREKFWDGPTDIGAKYLWLQYTKSEEDVPSEIMERMIHVIKSDIKRYQDDGNKRRSLPGVLKRKKIEEPVYALLHCAKEDPDLFWQILYPPSGDKSPFHLYSDLLLSEARLEFPHKRKLQPGELYDFFGKQIGLQVDEDGGDIGERMRFRYRTYKKNLNKEAELSNLFKPYKEE